MNKCPSKFNVSVRRKDDSFYNLKTSLLSVRAALDHHLKSPPHNKTLSSATTVYLFRSSLSPKAIYKCPLTGEAIMSTSKELCDKVLSLTFVILVRVLHQAAWLIAIYFGKRVG